jgi:hypothetical protein
MKKILLLSLLLIACDTTTQTTKVTPNIPPTPTPLVIDSEYCGEAEVHLKEIACIPKNEPYTKRGKSFKQFCEETQENGVFLNPKCLTTVNSCEEIDYCTMTRKK